MQEIRVSRLRRDSDFEKVTVPGFLAVILNKDGINELADIGLRPSSALQ
jgi:hypothetical protein